MSLSSIYTWPLEAPAFYTLEITSACNNTCTGCGNVFLHKNVPLLRFASWHKILEKIIPWAKKIKITGGEPTLHPDFIQIVEDISDSKVPFSIFTNGIWVDSLKLIRTLVNASSCSGLLVSLHGDTPSLHASFGGKPETFNEIVNNIKLAISHGLPVSISTVITKSNSDYISEIVAFSECLGVEHIAFNRYIGTNFDIQPSTSQFRNAIRIIENKISQGKKIGYGVCIPFCFEPNQSHGCSAGTAYGAIDPWGKVRPCAHSLVTTKASLLETSIQDIWASEEIENWRQQLVSGCDGCKAVSVCRGGCTALKQLCGLEHDPLMNTQLSIDTWVRPQVLLPSKAFVKPKYDLIERGEILILVSDTGILNLSMDAKHLLNALDSLSLEEISDKSEKPLLDFVGYLYARGMVDIVLN